MQPSLTAFRKKVYDATKKIPKGKVATYKQLAEIAGNPNASRAVGIFMRTNPNAPIVPCHRVVGFDGSLIGYSGVGGVLGKKKMLLAEGVKFNGNKVDLAVSGWSNSK